MLKVGLPQTAVDMNSHHLLNGYLCPLQMGDRARYPASSGPLQDSCLRTDTGLPWQCFLGWGPNLNTPCALIFITLLLPVLLPCTGFDPLLVLV